MKLRLSLFSVAAIATCTFAQTSPSPTATAAGLKQSTRPLPFHGMISAVDQQAKTFTTTSKENSRVFKITDKTKITKAGKTATIAEITGNQEVSGSYWQRADGTLEAKNVKLGPAKIKAASPSPSASP